MSNFILAITTFNRISYLKKCIETWDKTKSSSHSWSVIVADDGSTDGTLEYLDQLELGRAEKLILKNNRLGIHQQMNTILTVLEKRNFDFCFKVDDDFVFKKPCWDTAYYKTAIETGFHHLVYCDEKWDSEQIMKNPIKNGKLIAKQDLLNIQGHFYTISPTVLKKVGYFDVENFGFRGMGHVDYTARCARAGFSDIENPWDLMNSDKYFASVNEDYKSALPSIQVAAYDEMNRERKTAIIKNRKSAYVPSQEINHELWDQFQKEVLQALSSKAKNAAKEKLELEKWYMIEIKKTQEWYQQKINKLPNWYIALGNKLFGK